MSKLTVVRNTLELLEPVRVGNSNMSVNIHPRTRTQYDYIRETLMEAGITSGMVHHPDEPHSWLRGLGKHEDVFTIFTV